MFQREQIRKGMEIRSRDGERLGQVRQIEAEGFTLEQGVVVSRDYWLLFEDIAAVQGDVLVLLRDKREVQGALEEAARTGTKDVSVRGFEGGLHLRPRAPEGERGLGAGSNASRTTGVDPMPERDEEEGT